MSLQKIPTDWIVGNVFDAVVCPICQMVLHDPVKTPCEHVFCRDCIEEFLKKNDHPFCPNDRRSIAKNELAVTALYFRQMLNELQVRCPEQNCGKTVRLDGFESHKKECRLETFICEKGCGSRLIRKDAGSHNCIEELRGVIDTLRREHLQQRTLDDLRKEELLDQLRSHREVTKKMLEKSEQLENRVVALRQETALEAVVAASSATNGGSEDVVPFTSEAVFHVKTDTYKGDATNGVVKSEVLNVAGVKWQMVIKEIESRTRYLLKCYGPKVVAPSPWEVSSTINLEIIKTNGQPPRAIRLGRRRVSSDQMSTGFSVPEWGSWFTIVPQAKNMDGVVEIKVKFLDCIVGKDWLEEYIVAFDFEGLGKLNEFDQMRSPDVTFAGYTWNIVLIINAGALLCLFCNDSLSCSWRSCGFDVELRVKGKNEIRSSCEKNFSFSLSHPRVNLVRLSKNELSAFVVNGTLSVLAKIKVARN